MFANLLRLILSVASKWASKHRWEYHLFCRRRFVLSLADRSPALQITCGGINNSEILIDSDLFIFTHTPMTHICL